MKVALNYKGSCKLVDNYSRGARHDKLNRKIKNYCAEDKCQVKHRL